LAGISLFVSCFSSLQDTQDEYVSVGDLKSFSFGTCCKLWKICWKWTCLPETCNLLSFTSNFQIWWELTVAFLFSWGQWGSGASSVCWLSWRSIKSNSMSRDTHLYLFFLYCTIKIYVHYKKVPL
jgi:hypothetical protein